MKNQTVSKKELIRQLLDIGVKPGGGGLLSAGIAVNTVIDRTYVSLPASNIQSMVKPASLVF